MEKKRSQISFTHIFIEILSVVFAVLLALFLNEWRQNLIDSRLAARAFENIRAEMEKNKEILEKLKPKHHELTEKIRILLPAIHEKEDILLKNGVPVELLGRTSWETAILTRAVNQMDFGILSQISEVYALQAVYSGMVNEFYNEYSSPGRRVAQAVHDVFGNVWNFSWYCIPIFRKIRFSLIFIGE